jgi:hypothetical protein
MKMRTCDHCGGSGKKHYGILESVADAVGELLFLGHDDSSNECPFCDGSGQVEDEEEVEEKSSGWW